MTGNQTLLAPPAQPETAQLLDSGSCSVDDVQTASRLEAVGVPVHIGLYTVDVFKEVD